MIVLILINDNSSNKHIAPWLSWRFVETLGEVHCDDGYWVHVSGSIFHELEAVEVSVAALKTESKKKRHAENKTFSRLQHNQEET